MKTVIVQIGNSDDKLGQKEWAAFCAAAEWVIPGQIHFSGSSPGNANWQNHCWVSQVTDSKLPELRNGLAVLCRRYKQDSIALTVGDTEFVPAGPEIDKSEIATCASCGRPMYRSQIGFVHDDTGLNHCSS